MKMIPIRASSKKKVHAIKLTKKALGDAFRVKKYKHKKIKYKHSWQYAEIYVNAQVAAL